MLDPKNLKLDDKLFLVEPDTLVRKNGQQVFTSTPVTITHVTKRNVAINVGPNSERFRIKTHFPLESTSTINVITNHPRFITDDPNFADELTNRSIAMIDALRKLENLKHQVALMPLEDIQHAVDALNKIVK